LGLFHLISAIFGIKSSQKIAVMKLIGQKKPISQTFLESFEKSQYKD
jgi:hypothetical protein